MLRTNEALNNLKSALEKLNNQSVLESISCAGISTRIKVIHPVLRGAKLRYGTSINGRPVPIVIKKNWSNSYV